MVDMITKRVFDGSMELFQEGMRRKLIEVINDVISGKDYIVKGNKK